MIRRCSRYHREHSSDSLAAGKIQIHFDGNWSDFDLTGARGRDPCKPGGMTPVYRASAFGLGRKGSAAVGTMTVGGRIRNSRMLGKPCNKRIPGRRSAASLSKRYLQARHSPGMDLRSRECSGRNDGFDFFWIWYILSLVFYDEYSAADDRNLIFVEDHGHARVEWVRFVF